ncbi:DUF6241 domain-containing protein [Paenisporosarcina macmurdoensis]|uniref:DUF6241 domain-containing protein n=1 Tax=Paenisporosarcina macmurdoensis TaxID=212659 RepID=A0ABW1L5P4_9BACL
MKTFKFTKIQKAIFGVAIFGLIGALVYSNMKPDLPVFLKKDIIMTETIAEDGGAIIEVEEDVSVIEAEFPLTMSDESVRNAIHSMSHQKIVAEDDEKWGAKIPLTQKRVERLLEVVEVRQHDDNFKHESVYFEILNLWVDGDFSQSARDHNNLWYMENGNIGYATGIMSHDEEMEYIRVNFDVNE